MLKSKKALGIMTVVEIQLSNNSDKSYITENGIVSHNCHWCNKAYNNDDGTPKIYKLSELQANGSNLGLPKGAWKPVIGAHHFRCRCQLFFKN